MPRRRQFGAADQSSAEVKKTWKLLGYFGSDARLCWDRPQGFATAIRNAGLYLDGRVKGEPHFPDPYIDADERRELQAAASLPVEDRIERLIAFAVSRGGSENAARQVVADARRRAARSDVSAADAIGVRKLRAVER